MSFKFLGVRIKIGFLLIVMLTLFSFFDKSGLFLIAFLSALLHEMGHVLAAHFCSCGIKELHFMPFGIKMILKIPLSLVNFKPKLCILFAGCAVNIILGSILLVFSFKTAALINFATAIFNLLPAKTLDGGRILLEILNIKFDPSLSEKVSDFISIIFSILLFILGAFLLFYSGYNVSLIFTSIYLAITVIIRQKRLNW